MADLFDSAWLKWVQGVGNAQILLDNIVTLAEQPDLKMESWFGQHYDAKRHCIRIFAQARDPFPVHWGPMLGDVIHNYRSSLDHIAWALYKRGRTPDLPDQERFIYWPITSKPAIFKACLKGDRAKLPGVRRADIAIVRKYQPYTPGQSRVHRHVFTVLDALANADKHRTIQPVVAVPHGLTLFGLNFFDCIPRKFAPSPRWDSAAKDEGAELGRFYVKKEGPEPRVDMQPHFSLVPAVNEFLTVSEFLEKTMTATSIVLREFAKPPQSVQDRLAAHVAGLDVLRRRDSERRRNDPFLAEASALLQ